MKRRANLITFADSTHKSDMGIDGVSGVTITVRADGTEVHVRYSTVQNPPAVGGEVEPVDGEVHVAVDLGAVCRTPTGEGREEWRRGVGKIGEKGGEKGEGRREEWGG